VYKFEQTPESWTATLADRVVKGRGWELRLEAARRMNPMFASTNSRRVPSPDGHEAMSRILPEFFDPDPAGRSTPVDVLAREEPEEDDDDEEEEDEEEGEDDRDSDGYSE
jgi:hypothetical protein